MAIEFKTPSESDVAMMKEFANVIDSAMTIALKPEMSHVSHDILKKLQEALFWFSHGVLNKPSPEPVIAAITDGTLDEVLEDAA